MLVPVLNVYFPVKTLISLGWINHDESLSEKKKKKSHHNGESNPVLSGQQTSILTTATQWHLVLSV